MTALVAILLIFLSVTMLIQTRFVHSLARKTRAPSVLMDLLFFHIYIKILMYYLAPSIFRMVSDFHFERMDGIDPWSVAKLYLVELVSWFFYLTTFIIVTKKLFQGEKTVGDEGFLWRERNFSKFFILVCALGFCLTPFISALGLEANPFFIVLRSVFFYCGLTAGPLLVLLSGKVFRKHIFFFGIVVTMLGSLSLDTRGAVVYMLLFTLFVAWRIRKEQTIKLTLLAVFFVLGVTYALTGGLPTVPLKLNDSGDIVLDFKNTSEKREGRSNFEELDWRFGASTRLGTKFFDMYDRGDSAGIKPIKHSLSGWLPRALSEDKPIPSTLVPNDIYTQGMYLIYRETYGYDTYSMSEFPTGAHFYWEFGMAGVFILSILSACYISISIRLFSALGLASIPLVVALFKPWGYMDPKIWLSDASLQIYQISLPTLALFFMYKLNCLFKTKLAQVGAYKAT